MKAQEVNSPQPATPLRVIDPGEPDTHHPTDPVRVRLLELLTGHNDVAINDRPDGGTYLHHHTALQLANVIAADQEFETLITARAADGAGAA